MSNVSHPRSVSALSTPGDFQDQQRLSDLISAVYDAAIEASLWESAIERIAGLSAVPAADFSARMSAFRTPDPTALDSDAVTGCLFQQIYQPPRGLSRRP
jgi:hypothetical protein